MENTTVPKHSQYLNDGFDSSDDQDDYAEFGDTSARPQRMRRRVDDSVANPNRKGRLTLEERARLAIERENQDMAPPEGDRWSNWVDAGHGPEPRPEWVITEQGACDHELGVLKTGKEADVFLLRRVFPDTGAEVTMAAKRYRSNEHRNFQRDAGYLEGRRLRRTRDMRAIEGRTSFGMNLIAQQWAIAEFGALSELWQAGVPVPYPVQLYGTELLMEFIGEADGTAAPRLAQMRPDPDELLDLWEQLVSALLALAERGQTHGDLSPYNLLVHHGRLVLIDLPQVVDVVVNPKGREYMTRDVHNVAKWFLARGLPERFADPEALLEMLASEARLI
ncbi:RIO kinase 1 [Catenulispora sp. EB89]